MSSVMIRCPNTGHAASTAIETEPSVFRKLPNLRAHCPASGQEHLWRTATPGWKASRGWWTCARTVAA